MSDKIDIIKRHILLLDEELKDKFGEGFDYATEDALLDVICTMNQKNKVNPEELIENYRLLI